MVNNTINYIKQLNRRQKQSLMISIDMLLLPFSFWLALSLRLSNLWPIQYWYHHWWLLCLIPVISIPLFIHYGLYRSVLKYMGYQVIIATIKAITITCLAFGTLLMLIREISFPQPTIIIFWFVSILVIVSSRYIMKSILYLNEPLKKPIGIYGAGEAGAQLIDNLRVSSDFIPVALFDDDPAKWGTVINSMWVYSSDEMQEVIQKNNIKIILLGILGISVKERKRVLLKISQYPVQVRMISSIENLISGNFNIRNIRSVQVDDILGREIVRPDHNLLSKNIKGKNILVTGAGGSIGKELCKQILNLKPKKLILLENNEYALYKVHMSLNKINNYITIIPILSSTLDYIHMKEILLNNQIHTLYHTAAYKHVPIVEMNPLDGIYNNIIGTYNCTKAALEAKIDDFILISTDKAVRPANIMGATKRFSELILQGAQMELSGVNFSIVRFGKVINSAGSVVPLFKDQISKGGPVTVTHPDVTRYFMSIPEAVELVIQAGAMARGGEVFVLEMGDPIRIFDLAVKMIHLSGFEPQSSKQSQGDIEIRISGLRPGEKLDEELIIGNNVYETEHPQILKAEEHAIKWKEIEEKSLFIKSACESRDINQALTILKDSISEWKPVKDLLLYGTRIDIDVDESSDIAEC